MLNLAESLSDVLSDLKEDLRDGLLEASETFSQDCHVLEAKYKKEINPRRAEIYEAASLYLQGKIDGNKAHLYDLVAYGLYMPIRELDNRYVVADRRKLEILLNRYKEEAKRGALWEMTWFGVFQAYYEPSVRYAVQDLLLQFLKDTYPYLLSLKDYRPLWLRLIDENLHLLEREPASTYVEQWLAGDEHSTRQITSTLLLGEKSWFWEDLVRTSIRFVTDKPDEDFKSYLPKILSVIEETSLSFDEDLTSILYRYNQCLDKTVPKDLKAFILRHWGNPKLKYDQSSKWRMVPEDLWRLVLSWVKEEHLQKFFECISSRKLESQDQLSVWLRYLSWAKLLSDYEVDPKKKEDQVVINLFKAEEAVLSASSDDLDAKLEGFLQQMESYLSL